MQDDLPEGTCSTQGHEGFGAACSSDTTCVSLFCDGGFCGKPCNPFGPNTCTYGLVCSVSKGSVGACAVAKLVAGEDAGTPVEGDACQTGSYSAGGDSAGGDSASGGDTASSGSDSALATDVGPQTGVPTGNSGSGSALGCSAATGPVGGRPWPMLATLLALCALLLRRRRSA